MIKNKLIQQYYSQTVMFGGVPTKRIDIINYLKSIGGTPQMINIYLMTLDKKQA